MSATGFAALTCTLLLVSFVPLCSCDRAEKNATTQPSRSAQPAANPRSAVPTVPVVVPVPQVSTSPAPVTGIAADGFPTGQDSPEGVACDMARGFIQTDSALFRKSCLKRMGNSDNDKKYNAFLDEMAGQIEAVAKMPKGAGGGPKSIDRVYKVRGLSRNGPASAGFAIYRFSETKFVDVVTPMHGEPEFTSRTLVVQDEDTHLWYAIPRPDLFPLLSMGLNEEADSTELWTAPKR